MKKVILSISFLLFILFSIFSQTDTERKKYFIISCYLSGSLNNEYASLDMMLGYKINKFETYIGPLIGHPCGHLKSNHNIILFGVNYDLLFYLYKDIFIFSKSKYITFNTKEPYKRVSDELFEDYAKINDYEEIIGLGLRSIIKSRYFLKWQIGPDFYLKNYKNAIWPNTNKFVMNYSYSGISLYINGGFGVIF